MTGADHAPSRHRRAERNAGPHGTPWPLPLALATVMVAWAAGAGAQPTPAPYEPEVGQGGKDVIWVPTPPALVETMLDLARVTRNDLVIDLGSGDGRNVIAAAKRGARAIGIEFNPEMVALATRLADEAGVAGRTTFIEGDMFTADISKATVMALFLLPTNLEQLREKFLALAPGTRIVLNTFTVPDWLPDEKADLGENCASWCTALLYYVPAPVAGRWTTVRGELTLTQEFQVVAGTLAMDGRITPVSGRLHGTALTLDVDGETLQTTVLGDRLDGPQLSGARARP